MSIRFDHRCTIIKREPRETTDSWGQPIVITGVGQPNVFCHFFQKSSRLIVTQQGLIVYSSFCCWFPLGTEVDIDDYVQFVRIFISTTPEEDVRYRVVSTIVRRNYIETWLELLG